MPASLHVTWEAYNALVERLALIVHDSGFAFDQVICIARGGLRVGDVLSRIFSQPLAILSTHSYTAEGGTVRDLLDVDLTGQPVRVAGHCYGCTAGQGSSCGGALA